MVLEDVVSDQLLLRTNDAAELALVPPDIPPHRPRRRFVLDRADAATVQITFSHLTSPRSRITKRARLLRNQQQIDRDLQNRRLQRCEPQEIYLGSWRNSPEFRRIARARELGTA
jgi:hypothetical protein